MRRRDVTRYSHAMRYALSLVERMSRRDVVVVPSVPSPPMVEAGAKAGKVPRPVARLIYRTMIDHSE